MLCHDRDCRPESRMKWFGFQMVWFRHPEQSPAAEPSLEFLEPHPRDLSRYQGAVPRPYTMLTSCNLRVSLFIGQDLSIFYISCRCCEIPLASIAWRVEVRDGSWRMALGKALGCTKLIGATDLFSSLLRKGSRRTPVLLFGATSLKVVS